MELRHLRYFLAVAEELNFRKAAARLQVSAPTISEQIQNLEKMLGVRLLDRSGSRIFLTDGGSVLLKDARQILRQTERARGVAQSAARGHSGTLRIGNLGAAGYSFMPACIEMFRRLHPRVEIVLVNLEVEEQFAALESGDIQIAFTPLASSLLPKRLGHFVAMRTYWRLVMHNEHRLSATKRLRIEDINDEPLVCFSDSKGAGPLDLILRALAAHNVSPGPVTVVRGVEACIAMVAAAQGVAFFPSIPFTPPVPGLRMRAFAKPVPEMIFELRVVWREADTSPHIENFLTILSSHAVDHTIARRLRYTNIPTDQIPA